MDPNAGKSQNQILDKLREMSEEYNEPQPKTFGEKWVARKEAKRVHKKLKKMIGRYGGIKRVRRASSR